MGKRSKKDDNDWDTGETIADMSEIPSHGVMSGAWLPQGKSSEKRKEPSQEPMQEQERPWEDDGMTKKERFWTIMGAMKAAILISLVFIVGLGLLTILLLWIWT